MPIGLQLIGNLFQEQRVFDGAMSLERAITISRGENMDIKMKA